MSNGEIDYGPLAGLIGVWKGDKGTDIAPEPDGTENTPYRETITYTAIGDVKNAGEQVLTALHYRQIVQRKSDDEVFHDQTGYWMWDAAELTVMHSLQIPRAVSVLAGGHFNGETNEAGQAIIEVSASAESNDWKIIESPFMAAKASTRSFSQKIVVGDGNMSYSQTTLVDIYGSPEFLHTDENELVLG
ncbi:MAG: hypothetical protein CMM52_03415 [Rhodospirillaceae bacterium]|nr:hypothetical protein [Rhodospirillaceae bacterium]|tara:strand:+ start:4998 stop:5564 length:567 start_codon:yes stop_codon:yes gene_type:complete